MPPPPPLQQQRQVQANDGPDWRPNQHSVDTATGDSAIDPPPPAAVLYPHSVSSTQGSGSWADGFAGMTGDANARGGGGGGGSGIDGAGSSSAGATGSVASSGGLRRGVTSTARHRASPLEPSLLDLAAQPTAVDKTIDPRASGANLDPDRFEDTGPPRSPSGPRPPLPGPYDAPSQQQGLSPGTTQPHSIAAPQRGSMQHARVAPGPPPQLDDPLEASLQAAGTLAALQQADGFRLSSPRPSEQRPQSLATAPVAPLPLPQQSQQLPSAPAGWSQSEYADMPHLHGTSVPPQAQPAKQDQRQARRGWGVPAQPPHAASAPPQPPLPPDPQPPPWARDASYSPEASAQVAAPWGLDSVRDTDSGDGGDSTVGYTATVTELPPPPAAQRQVHSPVAVRHSVAVGDSGGPEMWQRNSIALQPLPGAAAAATARHPHDGDGATAALSPPQSALPHVDLQLPRPVMTLSPQLENGEGGPGDWQQPDQPHTGAGLAHCTQMQGQGQRSLITSGAAVPVDMSADLVRYSSPPGPSRTPSDNSAGALAPESSQLAVCDDNLELMQQQAEREQPQHQQRHRLASVSYEGAAVVKPAVVTAAKEEGPMPPAFYGGKEGGTQHTRALQPGPQNEQAVDPVQAAAGVPLAAPEPSGPPGLRLTASQGVTLPSGSLQALSSAAAQVSPQGLSPSPPQAPLLPPIAPGRPLSGSAARLSNSGYSAAPPVSLPPLSPQSTAGEGEAASALTQLQALQQQQQQQAPFRAPSPPASPPRNGSTSSQRFQRQHSGTPSLAVSGSVSSGGGVAAGVPQARAYSYDGQGAASTAAAGYVAVTTTQPSPSASHHQPEQQQQQQLYAQQQRQLPITAAVSPSCEGLQPGLIANNKITRPELNGAHGNLMADDRSLVRSSGGGGRPEAVVAAQSRASLASPATIPRSSVVQEPPVVTEEPSEEAAAVWTPVSRKPMNPIPFHMAGASGAAGNGLTSHRGQGSGDTEGELEGEAEVDAGEVEEDDADIIRDRDDDGRGRRVAILEGPSSLERPPGTAEGSVMTGSHISARPWSGPSSMGPSGGSRLAGSGYQNSLLDDSVSSFDFRMRSAAASRPTSASPSCSPLPQPSETASSLLYPTVAAAAATSSASTASTSGPSAAAVDVPVKSSGLQGPYLAEGLQVATGRQGSATGNAGWTKGHAPAVTHGSAVASNKALRRLPAVFGGGGGGSGGSNGATAAIAAPNTFQVLQQAAAGRTSGSSDMYVSEGDGEGQPFVEEPVDDACGEEALAAGPAVSAGPVTAATPLMAAAVTADKPDPDLDELMREIQELSALRKALKVEFEIMGRGDAVADMGTLSANFVALPAVTAAAAAAAATPDAEDGYMDAAIEMPPISTPPPPLPLPPQQQQEQQAQLPSQLPAAARAPLLQWNIPGQPVGQAKAVSTPAAPTVHAPEVVATGLSVPASTAHPYTQSHTTKPPLLSSQFPHSPPQLLPGAAHLDIQKQQQVAQPQPQQQPQLIGKEAQERLGVHRWQSTPQLPITVLAAPSHPPSSNVPAAAVEAAALPPSIIDRPSGPAAVPSQLPVPIMVQGPNQGYVPISNKVTAEANAPAFTLPGATPASGTVNEGAVDARDGSFAFASPATATLGSVGILAGGVAAGGGGPEQAAPLPLAPPMVVPALAPVPAAPALQWTIPANGFVDGGTSAGRNIGSAVDATTTTITTAATGLGTAATASPSGRAVASIRKTAAVQPKRSPSGGGAYAAPASAGMDSPGPGSGSGSGVRRGGGMTATHMTGDAGSIGRQAAPLATTTAVATTERPLVNEGSYAQAAVQARERAERERAAREALQAEAAAAKAAIIQRSKSDRAGAGTVAVSPSAGAGSKDASPLGPKAPSAIGSYVRHPSPARAAPVAAAPTRSGAPGDASGGGGMPASEAAEMAPAAAAVMKQAWGTPSTTGQHSRIPTPPRAPAAAPTTVAVPPPPPASTPPRPTREDSLGSDFDFLERASDTSGDSETESPEAYGVSSKASPSRPPRREAFAPPAVSATASNAATAASTAYRERLAEARPQPLRIPSTAAATPMGGASTASTVASRAMPTGGRGHVGGTGPGAARAGGRGPSTPFTAAIRELMGLPGSAPLEQSRAAAGKQQQQQVARAQVLSSRGPTGGQAQGAAAAGRVEPIRLLSEEEDKLLASLKRLDADILRRGLMAAGIINDPLPSQPPAVAAPGRAAGKSGKAVAPRQGAGKGSSPSPLTNSIQQDQLRESLERLDVQLGALRRKMEERACSLGSPSARGAASGIGTPGPDAAPPPPREERRGPPATLAKSRTPTPNKAKAIRDQRQQQLSAAQGPTPPPARAAAASGAGTPQLPKPASAPAMGTMGSATGPEASSGLHLGAGGSGSATTATLAAAGGQPLGMPPRAPAAKAPSSAPSGPAASNAAAQQQQQQQPQLLQHYQPPGSTPFGAMPSQVAFSGHGAGSMIPPMFAPPPQLLPPQQQHQMQPGSASVLGGQNHQQQQVAYVPAMLPNGQMAFVPQYVQPSGAIGAFPGVFPGAPVPGFVPTGPMQAPQQQQQQQTMMPPMMMMMPPGQVPGQMPGAGATMLQAMPTQQAYPQQQPQQQLQQQQQIQLAGSGPMLAWGAGPVQAAAVPPPPPQSQQLQQNVSYNNNSGNIAGPSLYSFDRSGPVGHGMAYRRSSQDGSTGGSSPAAAQQQQQSSMLPYAMGPPPSGPMPHYHSTVMRSRSIGSKDGEAMVAAAAAAGLTIQSPQSQLAQNPYHHQQLMQSQQSRGQAQPEQQHQQIPYSDQQGAFQQQIRDDPYPQRGQGQGHGTSSHPHKVQVQSFGPNGSSRGLGSASGWGMSGNGGADGADAGVIKAVNLGLLLS
ncbi:hypothetical protein Vretimale_10067 [Volvox reticuliferus]|nr:hypothetical protein Vretimale_10067 [Volvox reticuliferus]